MNPASLISQTRSRFRVFVASSPACAVLAVALFSAVALFCYNWTSSSTAAVSQQRQGLALAPKAGIVAGAQQLAAGLAPVANPRFGEAVATSVEDPFQSLSRDMLTAAADPFLYALASGTGEGRLELRAHGGGIPVYGPPVPRLRYRSDAEVLRMLPSGVDGPFRGFFSNVFGETAAPGDVQDASSEEANPFRKARESATDAPAPAQPAATEQGEPQETAGSSEQASSETESAPRPKTSPGSFDVWRPSVLMKVEHGWLESVPVSHPEEGVFESAELGFRDFDLLAFSEPTEFPLAIAVADFNADGRADAAVHAAENGVVRLFLTQPDGAFQEQLRVQVGTGPRSIAAADFNADGLMDLAVSSIGTGTLTILFGEAQNQFRFKTQWVDVARDYIMAKTVPGRARVQLLGMNFAGPGAVLLDFTDPAGTFSGAPLDYEPPALDSALRTARGWWPKLTAVVLNSSLALNLDNRGGHLSNVVNVAPGADTYLVAGDLDLNGTLTVAIARKR